MIHESVIHFIWKHQAFDHRNLTTEAGEILQIVNPGEINSNAGPDFLNAVIRINDLEWNGSVEIHVRSSDWQVHGHSGDRAYGNVVLHVVWMDNQVILREDGTVIPALVISGRTNPGLVHKYQRISASLQSIPCSGQPISLNALRSALENALATRLNTKSAEIFRIWQRCGMDWEQTAFVWFSRHIGFNVNHEVFQALGESLTYKILQKHRDRPDQLEALLFGMAGLLESGFEQDTYWLSLRREFRFLKYKYGLKPRIKAHEWKFLRLRPANFPTLRLAQLASVLAAAHSLFNWIIYSFDDRMDLRVSPYWQNHYYFGKRARGTPVFLGKSGWKHLRMNVVIPLKYALALKNGRSTGEIEKVSGQIQAEDNRITRMWEKTGVNMESALDSQSYYALYQQACKLHKCLSCPVGIELLRSA